MGTKGRRLLGVALLLYGLGGLVVLIGGAWLISSAPGGLGDVSSAIDANRRVLGDSLDATTSFVDDLRSSTDNVRTSLTGSSESARRTGTLIRSLGSAMNGLAAASQVSIFGSQPLAGLGSTFSDVATQAGELGTSLDATADDLTRNATDLATVRDDLATISGRITSLRSQLNGSTGLAGAATTIDSTRLVIGGLLGWLVLQALGCVAAGLWLLVRPAARTRVVLEPADQRPREPS